MDTDQLKINVDTYGDILDWYGYLVCDLLKVDRSAAYIGVYITLKT